MRGIDSVYEDKNDSGMTLYQSNDTLNEFRRQGDEIMVRILAFVNLNSEKMTCLNSTQLNLKLD